MLPVDCSSCGIYYRRELLTNSLEGRRIDLLTISGTKGQLDAREGPLPSPLLPESGPQQRPHRFKGKKYVFLTARVHPGETPASHVFDGFLQFILRPDDPRAIALRERFVFKLIPMLNPDGVYHGHYRFDTKGVNLNRAYVNSSHEKYPSAFGCLAVADDLHKRGELVLYVDCHAHAGRRGCFFYGCRGGGGGSDENVAAAGSGGAPPADLEDAALFAKLVSLNTRWLDFSGCTWFEPAAHEGSARAAIRALTGLPHIFTLECNYDSGTAANELPPRQNGESCRSLSPEPKSSKNLAPKYDSTSWREVGRGIALAVLDLADANPHSRVPRSGGGDGLNALRVQVAATLQKAAASGKGAGKEDGSDAEEELEWGLVRFESRCGERNFCVTVARVQATLIRPRALAARSTMMHPHDEQDLLMLIENKLSSGETLTPDERLAYSLDRKAKLIQR